MLLVRGNVNFQTPTLPFRLNDEVVFQPFSCQYYVLAFINLDGAMEGFFPLLLLERRDGVEQS